MAVNVSVAQEQPEYEGVYLRLKDGTLIRVERYDVQANAQRGYTEIPIYSGSDHTGSVRVYPLSGLGVSVGTTVVESIVINTRQPGQISLVPIIKLRDYAQRNPEYYTQYGNFGPEYSSDQQYLLSALDQYVANLTCGYVKGAFLTKNINNFTTEYKLTSEISSLRGFTHRNCGKNAEQILPVGFTIIVGNAVLYGEYPFLMFDD